MPSLDLAVMKTILYLRLLPINKDIHLVSFKCSLKAFHFSLEASWKNSETGTLILLWLNKQPDKTPR